MSRGPDFFVVGAPKCGTTAMDQYLSAHPNIFMCPSKDCYFFGRDQVIYGRCQTKERYLELFEGAGEAKRVGESSVFYLRSNTAAAEIKEFNPEAKVIAMLRNPVDMLYSLHNQFLFTANEDIDDFKLALEAEPDRKAGRRIPPLVMYAEGLHYRDMVRFADQLSRYFNTFGRERVHVILFDDFVRDLPLVYRETLRFLEVEETFMPDFKVINPNKTVRFKALRDMVLRPQGLTRMLARALVPSRLRGRVVEMLWRVNARPAVRPPLDPVLRGQLIEEFRPEVEKLERLLGRDLSAWVKPQKRGG